MKANKKLFFPILALITALIFFPGVFWWWRQSLLPVDPSSTSSKLFVIQRGEGLSLIAEKLVKEGLVRNAFSFKVLVLVRGLSGEIQAGDFRLKPSMSAEELAHFLTHGSLDIWLTFPEGWRREEFARRLASNLENFDTSEFLALTQDLEGYLFPDTYLIFKEALPKAVAAVLNNNFEKKWTLELEREAQKQRLTEKQVLIFASIVEREARYEQDRPIVAGILLKRWRENWPLQADATIQYAVASQSCPIVQLSNCPIDFNWWPKKLTKADLGIDSPYNTYKYKGLPPAPICNSGLASIEAVIYPQKTVYWFYLSDKEGQMHYAETAEEHNQNILKYLK